MKTHRQALPERHLLQEYQVGRVLGAGGFGLTYLGWDTALDKAVAIKEYLPNELAVREQDYSVVPKSGDDDENFNWGLTRFIEEARTLAKFEHPAIVAVRRFFRAHNTAYIVMEYAEGETLGALLKRECTISEAKLLAILKPLLAGLQEVHAAGFLHRDIKPSNIIIRAAGSPAGNGASAGDGTSTGNGAFVGTAPCGCPPYAPGDSSPTGNGTSAGNGSPVLVDFGSARQAIGARSRSITSVVTPGYAPIEQYSTRGKQGAWTDIYALGALSYRALTGNTPPDATEQVVEDEIKPLAKAAKGKCTATLAHAIDSALAVKESNRPRDIAEWNAMLDGDDLISPPRIAATDEDNGNEIDVRESTRALAERAYSDTDIKVVYSDGIDVVSWFYKIVYSWTISSAEHGSVGAQCKLGGMYYYGRGVQKDYVEAAHWYNQSGGQGHADAQNHLGLMYANGEGVVENNFTAVRWYRKSAEQENAPAQYNLGTTYDKGHGLQQDDAQAAHWYRLAAEQGHEDAKKRIKELGG